MCSFVESEKKYIKIITILFIKNKTIIYNNFIIQIKNYYEKLYC
jgi:hypothetical protein